MPEQLWGLRNLANKMVFYDNAVEVCASHVAPSSVCVWHVCEEEVLFPGQQRACALPALIASYCEGYRARICSRWRCSPFLSIAWLGANR